MARNVYGTVITTRFDFFLKNEVDRLTHSCKFGQVDFISVKTAQDQT